MSKQTIVKHAVEVDGKVELCLNRDEARRLKRYFKLRSKSPKVFCLQYVLAKTDVVR